ncbi:ribonuclease H-like domain-containing protein, partial [Tanacetum coccineum]
MNTLSEETPRVKSSGSAGGKNRRISIGIKTSGKSSGEEVNSVPNYLRASTGSCHDICKYGKRHEHVKSAIPIKFQRTTVVDKEKVAKTVVPVEKKKTTTVKPSPVTVNRDVSAGSNAGIKKKEIKLRAESLKATKSRSAKKVAPLKDQIRMQKSEPKQTSSDKVQTQALQDGEAESESEPFSCNDIGEEESLITYTVNGRSDEELPENSTIMPTVIESSHASSDKEVSEVSLIALPEKKDAHGLLNNIIEETAIKLAESRKSKVKALVGAFEIVISLSKTANPLPQSLIHIDFDTEIGPFICCAALELRPGQA